MPGYDETFLAVPVPLPAFAMRLEGHVLRQPELREGAWRDYIHYSVAMNRSLRSPILSALNIDQTQFFAVKRSGWSVDLEIGPENQLDNDYYRGNRWDRGHLARRASAAHGATQRDAKRASDSTMFYTNACLQFDAFNQDEWLGLEDWVKDLMEDGDDKITVFSGPIYGQPENSVFVAPEARVPAEVPAAFFKVVCFMNRRGDFDVRAFNVPQDQRAMADWQGRNRVDHQTYQTTVAEIEHLTGIEFPEIVAAKNPLLFYDSPQNEAVMEELNIDVFPENIPVDKPGDMVAENEPRPIIRDDVVDVFIAGAMPHPKGRARTGEWVSILNLCDETVDLAGWELSDNSATVTLSGKLAPGTAKRIQGDALGGLKLSNTADILTLEDAEGQRIDRVRWQAGEAIRGRALFFPGRAPTTSFAARRPALV